MKTKLLAFSLFAATIGVVLAYPHHRGGTVPHQRHRSLAPTNPRWKPCSCSTLRAA